MCPSRTYILVPLTRHWPPSSVASTVMPDSSHRPFSSVNARVAIVSPEAIARQQRGLSLAVTAVDERVGGEHHRGEVGGAQQGAAHLLEHDDQLYVAEALSAVLLRDDQALEPELVRHLVPDLGVVARLGGHLLAHRRLRGLVVEEAADELAELLLLVAEGEVHGWASFVRAGGAGRIVGGLGILSYS